MVMASPPASYAMIARMATRDVVWAAGQGRGWKPRRRESEADRVRADSLIVAVDAGGRPYRARYRLECDAGWTTRRGVIERRAGAGGAPQPGAGAPPARRGRGCPRAPSAWTAAAAGATRRPAWRCRWTAAWTSTSSRRR